MDELSATSTRVTESWVTAIDTEEDGTATIFMALMTPDHEVIHVKVPATVVS